MKWKIRKIKYKFWWWNVKKKLAFYMEIFFSCAQPKSSERTTVFTAISLLFINKIQIKFLLSVYFYFDYTFFFILEFSNFYERSHRMKCFHKLLSVFFSTFFFCCCLFFSIHFFSFWSFFLFVSSLLLLFRCYRRSGVGPFFKPLDSLWFGQLLYFISMKEAKKKW